MRLSGVATNLVLQHRSISSLKRSSLQHHIAMTAVSMNRGICHSKSLVGHAAAAEDQGVDAVIEDVSQLEETEHL